VFASQVFVARLPLGRSLAGEMHLFPIDPDPLAVAVGLESDARVAVADSQPDEAHRDFAGHCGRRNRDDDAFAYTAA